MTRRVSAATSRSGFGNALGSGIVLAAAARLNGLHAQTGASMFAGDLVLSTAENEFARFSADLVGFLVRHPRTEEEHSAVIQDLFVLRV
jgi:hypothetical protein